jgi:hypothetical protein
MTGTEERLGGARSALEDIVAIQSLVAQSGPSIESNWIPLAGRIWSPEGVYTVHQGGDGANSTDVLDGREQVEGMLTGAGHQGQITSGCAYVMSAPLNYRRRRQGDRDLLPHPDQIPARTALSSPASRPTAGNSSACRRLASPAPHDFVAGRTDEHGQPAARRDCRGRGDLRTVRHGTRAGLLTGSFRRQGRAGGLSAVSYAASAGANA